VLLPIIEEAGVFTDWEGKAHRLRAQRHATNRALAGAARAALDVPHEPGK
jgi:hypothetical protein